MRGHEHGLRCSGYHERAEFSVPGGRMGARGSGSENGPSVNRRHPISCLIWASVLPVGKHAKVGCMIKTEIISGNALSITAPDKLKADDFNHILPQIDSLIRQYGKIGLLIDASGFHGWE